MDDPAELPVTRAERGWRTVRRLSARQLTAGAGIVAARMAGFVTGALAARALGPTGFASYTVAFTLFSALMQATSFSDTWMISRWGEKKEHAAIGWTVWRLKAWIFALFLLVAVAVSLLAPELLARFDLDGALLLLAVAAAGAGALTFSLTAMNQAEGRFRAYAVILSLSPILGAVSAGALFLAGVTDPFYYVLILLLSYVPLAAIATYRLLRDRNQTETSLVGAALRFGGWLTIGSLTYILYQRLDIFIVSALRQGPDVGIYGAAVRFSMAGALFSNTLVAVLTPAGSRQQTWMDRTARSEYLEECALGIGVTLLGIVALIALAPLLLELIVGPAYVTAASSLRVLLLGQFLLAAQMPFYFAMYAFHRGRWIAAIGITQLVFAGAVVYWLTATIGPVGAAWGCTLTYGVGAIGVAMFHRQLWREVRAA